MTRPARPAALLVPFALGLALWSFAQWRSFPRELWDVPAFWQAWAAATLLAGALGLPFARRPALPVLLVFAPLVPVLLAAGLMTGAGMGLLPLGLLAVAVLALPALGLSALLARLARLRA
ncbi:MAG: hypothetical protein N2422_10375 [Rhodobacteraceae bacterium]|nr:hypothetical protein [Paracoccaceae bacterium]